MRKNNTSNNKIPQLYNLYVDLIQNYHIIK